MDLPVFCISTLTTNIRYNRPAAVDNTAYKSLGGQQRIYLHRHIRKGSNSHTEARRKVTQHTLTQAPTHMSAASWPDISQPQHSFRLPSFHGLLFSRSLTCKRIDAMFPSLGFSLFLSLSLRPHSYMSGKIG